ncbi:membrane-spanning 4-domains subfamily A member 12-like isoform X3 [Sphaerodactylus townsendi]|uniref:membrane-spanning 4-domains subfamily A member 12-like isoform X3 n=1 Tax=Sphaerodactylus townsendi TaxID=933632 RepID=UPI0020268815|nr:membrane-spanning 4-domains subfamily A member 12-like isoform X3 [Sphaerodactylus townsendi]
MQGMGTIRLGRRAVMYTVETIPKGKNRVLGYIVSGCLSIGAEKSPTECAVKGSQAMNIISAIFALLGILTFIVDLSINGPFYSEDSHHYSLVMTGNRIAIVLLSFTILEFGIASATAYFWCQATRSDSNEAILIEPNTIRTDAEIPSIESSTNYPPNSNDVNYDLKVETV